MDVKNLKDPGNKLFNRSKNEILQNNTKSAVEQVFNCRSFMRSEETHNIVQSVSKCVDFVTKHISDVLNLNFSSTLSGSFAENTKCFAPDEFDFVLDCKTNLQFGEQSNFSLKVYACIDSLTRRNVFNHETKTGLLKLVSFLFGDKISCLSLIWLSNTNERLDITVDLAVCYKGEVIKIPRQFKNTHGITTKTYHLQEQQMLRKLPKHIRDGFILAKAVRIASIATPTNIQSFELQETIKLMI